MLDRRNLAELTDETKMPWVSRTERGSSASFAFFIGVRVRILEHNLGRRAEAHRQFYESMLKHLPGEDGYRSKQLVEAIKSEQQGLGPNFIGFTPTAPVHNGNGAAGRVEKEKGRFGRLVSSVGLPGK